MPRCTLTSVLLAGLAVAAPARAQDAQLIRFAPVFSHHMVLQRDQPIRIWGTGTPDTIVQAEFGKARGAARTAGDGTWDLRLPAHGASFEPRQLRIEARLGEQLQRVTLRDVLVGDVWLCTGQSNMRWRVSQSAEAEDVLEQAEVHGLRLLDFEGRLEPDGTRYDLDRLRQIDAGSYYTTDGWARARRETAATFSAVAFAFGRRLAREIDAPVGLVHNAIGGAPMQAFVPDAMADWMTSDAYPGWCRQRVKQNLASWFRRPTGSQPHHPFEPGFLFAAGVKPLAALPIKGVVWYQGESNATDTATSRARAIAREEATFRRVIAAFRNNWRAPELPFHFVQLPGLDRDWERFREMQDRVATTTEHCGMAVTIDLGHPTDVHPPRKVPVGERLAGVALRETYGRDVAAGGPRYAGHRADRSRISVRFDRPLHNLGSQRIPGFEIAGEDRIFHRANVVFLGNRVILSTPAVPRPVAVRYAYDDDPETSLRGPGGLPVIPFRSDDWHDATRAPTQRGTVEGFETGTGPLRSYRGSIGTWSAAAGHAEITDRFAHEGRCCLHVLGGADREVVLEFGEDQPARLRLQAERWTARGPFSFRIDAEVDGTWREVLDGDGVRVGARFLSPLAFDLPADAARLRFRCTSPDASGLLIDDVVADDDDAPMQIASCTDMSPVLPPLPGRRTVAARARLHVTGRIQGSYVKACVVHIDRHSVQHIEAVHALGGSALATTATPDDGPHIGGGAASEEPRQRKLVIHGKQALRPGDNDIDIELELRSDLRAEWVSRPHIVELVLDNGTHVVCDGRVAQRALHARVGACVRAAGEDGVHTTRIPGLTTTNAGTLIAVYDNRYRGSRDLPGDIDVGMSRSTDGGRTWEPMRVIMDMGDDPKWKHDGIGDPAVLVDRETGRIWVAATWSHGDRSWHGSGPGLTPEQTGQLMLAHSDDDGRTWSKPRNITEQVKDPKWRFVLQGPGRGITMHDGTLVFAAQYRSAPDGPHRGKPFSTILWSQDHGESWHIGTGVKVDTTEAQVVELDDGVLMINCRDNRGGSRSVYTTTDLGRNWQVHPSSRSALVEPVCMGSLLRVDHDAWGRLLLFSNPATDEGRFDLSIQVSRDDGRTWPLGLRTLYDQRKGYGYSCLTRIDREHVGVLYEGVRELYFVRFSLRELLR